MAQFQQLGVYKTLSDASREINNSIRYDMTKDAKCDIGDEIRKLMRDMKYDIYLINSRQGSEKKPYMRNLMDKSYHLSILLNECVDYGYLKIRGKYSIHNALKNMKDFSSQLVRWSNFIKRTY